MRLTRPRFTRFTPFTPFSLLTRSVSLRSAVILVALAGAIAVCACASTPDAGSGAPTPRPSPSTVTASNDLARTTWILTQMIVNGAAKPLVAGRVPTVQFHPQDGAVSGNAGCNGYGGDYTLAGETLSLNHLLQTLMACSDSSLMGQEYAYMSALRRVTRLQLADNTLTLSSSDGAVQLTYHPA